ncbi:MAG TPA: hypothetical protein VFA11_13110 [Acidimicrobiales bacterium]|nr:hypothetical protein [Acidimicrobiales bacterium]
MTDDDVIEFDTEPTHVDGALMISFGPVIPGREALAVELFTALSRYLGRLLADEDIAGFRPYFFADGPMNDVIGYFLVEGHREDLDRLRRQESFVELMLRIGAATQTVATHTLVAGTSAGRLVNLYAQIRRELGFIT